MPRAYRSRNAHRMPVKDWAIVAAVSLPLTLFAVLMILRVVFG